MERRRKVEMYEQMRREYEQGAGKIAGKIKGVARKFKSYRRMVREAIASAEPRERKVAIRERREAGAGGGRQVASYRSTM